MLEMAYRSNLYNLISYNNIIIIIYFTNMFLIEIISYERNVFIFCINVTTI